MSRAGALCGSILRAQASSNLTEPSHSQLVPHRTWLEFAAPISSNLTLSDQATRSTGSACPFWECQMAQLLQERAARQMLNERFLWYEIAWCRTLTC
jgi:hypothetical protein